MAQTILVIDDQLPTRRLLGHALRRRYTVLEAADPDAALERLATAEVDLIVLDLHFPPEGDSPRIGLLAFETFRARWPQIPIVILTSDDDRTLRAALLACGARAYLEKPFDPEHLGGMLRSILGGVDDAANPPFSGNDSDTRRHG